MGVVVNGIKSKQATPGLASPCSWLRTPLSRCWESGCETAGEGTEWVRLTSVTQKSEVQHRGEDRPRGSEAGFLGVTTADTWGRGSLWRGLFWALQGV